MKLNTDAGAANTARPSFFKEHRFAIVIVAGLMGLLIGSNVYQMMANANTAQENFGFKGVVAVYIDGKEVTHNNDVIEYNMYDFLMCKTWNDSTACDTPATGGLCNLYTGLCALPTHGCETWSTSGVANHPDRFTSSTRCTATAALLSTDTSIPNQSFSACPSYLTTNGFAPVQVTSSHVAGSNSLTLTATWTASGNQAGIDKACIGLWNDQSNNVVISPTSSSNPLAMFVDNFAAQSVTTGQSFQIQWTVSF